MSPFPTAILLRPWLEDLRRSVAANNGLTISAAPSLPWYKNSCITSALGKGALNVSLDAVGLLPEGGAVAGAFSLFHGAAGVSNGVNILQRVKFGTGLIGTANSASDGSGLSTGLGLLGIATSLGKAAPIVGQVISGASIVVDIYSAGKEIANCH